MDHRISLHKLEVFCLVVELGGVGRAAERLFVSQPVVTAHIRSLEERIGARLFFREGRQLHLTEAGRSTHAWATDVLTRTRELGRHLDGLSDGRRGSVVVGAGMSTGSYVLPSVLSRFRRDRPNVDVSLYVSESDHVMLATEAGECDFAVVIREGPPDSPALVGEHLRDEELVVVGGTGPELPEGPITAAELARLPMLDSPKGQARRSVIHHQLEKISLTERNVVLELGHPEAMKRVAAQGLGVALLFRTSVSDEIAQGVLREIRLRDATLAVPIYLTYRKGKHFSPSQRELMEAVREDIGAGA
jgi:DNA-binding transcriptional LysR family regulator